MAFRQLTRRLPAGVATYLPGGWRLGERATGGTDSAAYCYEIWLRHLIAAAGAGLPTNPRVVAELGPGDSLGTGIAALLTGASTYIAVDIVEYAATSVSVEMVDAVHELLARRAPLTLTVGDAMPVPTFPSHILGEERLKASLRPERVRAVRAALADLGREHDGIRVGYSAGAGAKLELSKTAEVVFSQAVLEHVDDLEAVYAQIRDALRPGGYMSHRIDFKSHDFARDWNGHWTFSDRVWKLIRGRRRFAINRAPLSTHLRLIEAYGFEIVNVERTTRDSSLTRADLAHRFRDLSDDDLETASAMIQAVKP